MPRLVRFNDWLVDLDHVVSIHVLAPDKVEVYLVSGQRITLESPSVRDVLLQVVRDAGNVDPYNQAETPSTPTPAPQPAVDLDLLQLLGRFLSSIAEELNSGEVVVATHIFCAATKVARIEGVVSVFSEIANKELADRTKLNLGSVRRNTAKLEELGILVKAHGAGDTSRVAYQIIVRPEIVNGES